MGCRFARVGLLVRGVPGWGKARFGVEWRCVLGYGAVQQQVSDGCLLLYREVRPGWVGFGGLGRGSVGHGKGFMTGAELKALRKELGLSLAQASRQVEVSARTWARWEAGDQAIPEGAMKLFRILNKLEKLK